MNELMEMHKQDIEKLESLDLVQSEDRMRIGKLTKGLSVSGVTYTPTLREGRGSKPDCHQVLTLSKTQLGGPKPDFKGGPNMFSVTPQLRVVEKGLQILENVDSSDKSATKTFQRPFEAYGDETLSCAHVFEWYKSFPWGRVSMEDKPTGRPMVSDN
ncbi:hypothetical protein TNCV_2658101 [Trichonephila clavipes]|nr:hypothetical protein TNCV_2658101 [Trichonephila clavipes]